MDRLFENSAPPGNILSERAVDTSEPDTYESTIKALIDDAVDFNDSHLAFEREQANNYYDGVEPSLLQSEDETYYDSSDTSPEEDTPSKSTVVSTDVRDTVMTVLPALMRIFAATEHALEFEATSEDTDEQARQATDYIRHKFWNDCDGFLTLYTAFKNALVNKIGVFQWGTDTHDEMREETYTNVTMEQVQALVMEHEDNEVTRAEDLDPNTGKFASVTIRFYKSKPTLWVESVPLDEFRFSRRAKNVKTSDITGREEYLRASDLIERGYDPEEVLARTGTDIPYNVDRLSRDPYMDQTEVFGDIVRFGEYYIRIDKDGDGIAELRRICVIGDDFYVVEDEVANDIKFGVISPDPDQHSLVGDSLAELVMDIQRINTNLIRGTLDSLAQSINPKTVINETLVNVEDALNEDLGAVIRTRGNPMETVREFTTSFAGRDAIEVKNHFDMIRSQRTGISDASRGLDPKALQSTALQGVDLIASGAQERIELIARVFAETGVKDMYKGLLREMVNNPNEPESRKIRGKWATYDPSTFDPSMNVKVNPALGKGSDMTRLMALNAIKQDQIAIITKFGLGNGMVGIEEYRNTNVDILEIANIRNVSRYFRAIDPQRQAAIEAAPKEPSPEELIAKAEYEKVKKDIVVAQDNNAAKREKSAMDDDFRRDKLNVDAFLDLVGIMAEFATAESPDATVSEQQSLNQPG